MCSLRHVSLICVWVLFYCVSLQADVDRPNIVIIICDDLNDSISGMGGHHQALTPNIDRLSDQGVRFVNAASKIRVGTKTTRAINIFKYSYLLVTVMMNLTSSIVSISTFRHSFKQGWLILKNGIIVPTIVVLFSTKQSGGHWMKTTP